MLLMIKYLSDKKITIELPIRQDGPVWRLSMRASCNLWPKRTAGAGVSSARQGAYAARRLAHAWPMFVRQVR